MVVADDRGGLDSRWNQEIHENRLEFRLTRFKVVARDEDLFFLSKIDDTWYEGILRRAIDVGNLEKMWDIVM